MAMPRDLVVVAIGRNEGERLRRCLESVAGLPYPVVYVDSGSQDGSPGLARSMGAEVVELDPGLPFTAGRGRNEGLARALAKDPEVEAVQFLDGDCELVPGWLERGRAELGSDPGLAAVCGRVREANRHASIYNRLCDMEWDAPPGETRSCGGNVLMRVAPFRAVGGFRPGFIAGEEPELCLRLRASGWHIRRLSDDMVRHDAAMIRFAQWWRRARRAGWAYAAGAAAHGASRERHNVREVRSIILWGGLLPVAALGLAVPSGGASLLLLGGFPLLWVRVRASGLSRGYGRGDAGLLATFTVLAKVPQFLGVSGFLLEKISRRRRGALDWRG